MATTVPVTVENFTRAESDLVFASTVERGGFGRWHHHRDQMPVDFPVVRPNRDTLYSEAVFDLDAGPVTITLPEAGRRFLSLQVINEDHYTATVVYTAGRYTFTRDQIGTRYVLVAVRILVNPADPNDIGQVHQLQDAIGFAQPGGPGRREVPAWNPTSHKRVRDALLTLAETIPDTKRMFGARDQVDPSATCSGRPWAGAAVPNRMPST
jgi:Protein of unknown function (DUF1254)